MIIIQFTHVSRLTSHVSFFIFHFNEPRILLLKILPQHLRSEKINLLSKRTFRLECDEIDPTGQCFRIADGLYFGEWILIGFELIAHVDKPAIHIDAVKSPQHQSDKCKTSAQDEQESDPDKGVAKQARFASDCPT